LRTFLKAAAVLLAAALWLALPSPLGTPTIPSRGQPAPPTTPPTTGGMWQPPPGVPQTLTEFAEAIRSGWTPTRAVELWGLCGEADPSGDWRLLLALAQEEVRKGTYDPIRGELIRLTRGHPDPTRPGCLILDGGEPERTYVFREMERHLGAFAEREIYEAARAWATDTRLPVLCRIEAVRLVRWEFDGMLEEIASKPFTQRSAYLVPLDPQARFGESDLAEAEQFLQRVADGAGATDPKPPDDGWDDPPCVRDAALAELAGLKRWGAFPTNDPPLPAAGTKAQATDPIVALAEDSSQTTATRMRQLDRLAIGGEYGLDALVLMLDRASTRGPLEHLSDVGLDPRPARQWRNG